MPIINITGMDMRHLGSFPDLAALIVEYPIGEPGDFAIVDGDPAAVWVWSEDSMAWENSGTAGSIVSVFARGGPAITAQYGDYSTNLLEDLSTLGGATLTDSLNSLALTQHTHSNKTELDLINQDLSTIADVNFHKVTVTLPGASNVSYEAFSAVNGPTTFGVVMTEEDSGSGVISHTSLETTSPALEVYVEGAGSVQTKVLYASEELVMIGTEEVLVKKDTPVLGETVALRLQGAAPGGAPNFFQISVEGDGSRVSLAAFGAATYVPIQTYNQLVIGGYAPISTAELTADTESGHSLAAAFNSNHANGVDTAWMVDSGAVLNIGSRLAIWGAGTKYEGIILGQDDLHVMGLNEVHIQEDTLVVQLAENRVGVNTATPETDLHVVGQLAVGDAVTAARMIGYDMGIMDSSAKLALVNYNVNTAAALDPMITFKAYNADGSVLRAHWDVGTAAGSGPFIIKRPGGGDYVMMLRADATNAAHFNSNFLRVTPSSGDAVVEIHCDADNDQGEDTNAWLSLKQDANTTHAVVGFAGANDTDMYGDDLIGIISNDLIVGHKTYYGLGLMTDNKLRQYISDVGLVTMLGQLKANAGLTLTTGATVDTIETTLTDDDTHLPTSGAVIGEFGRLFYQITTDDVLVKYDAANDRFVESGMRVSDAVLGGTIMNEIVFGTRPLVADLLDGDSWTYYDGLQLWHEKYVDGKFWQIEYGEFTP